MQNSKQIYKGSCILRIKGIYDSLKSVEKRLADYIIQNVEETVNLTMEELAKSSGSSYATISRFCKKVGFSGYKDFKNSLIQDVMRNRDVEGITDDFSIDMNTSTENICEKMFELSTKVLEESMSILDVSIVDKVVEKILDSNSLFFIGAGASGISAKYAYSKFFRIGIQCFCEPDSTLYKMKVSILKEGDVLFAISSSGRTTQIVDCAQIAKKNNVTVISLSDFAISPLTKVSDINLYTTPRNASLFLNIDMPLIISQITLIDILYSCCCIRKSEKAVELYRKTKASADSEKIQY
jgi:RpiR family transcriptional regulator, carbohydrate utilization regulator